jgi:hypothetical protein
MAAMERPAPAERIAVFEAMLLPGRALRMLVAVSFGSFCGGWASCVRVMEVVKVVIAGAVVRIGSVGRARAAPVVG